MHLGFKKSKSKAIYFFNSGMSNCVILMALSYGSPNHDIGKPFMSVIKIKKENKKYYNGFFGDLKFVECGEHYFVFSNWRRLPMTKITHMRDTFYSTLSTTMNSFMSSAQPLNYLINKKFQYIYSLRTILGYATNQKTAELLMDTRYAYMSALSYYTNINKLLVEKFGPPYGTCLEVWLIKRLLIRLPMIHEMAMKDGITQMTSDTVDYVRNVASIGGILKMPSLWGDYNMKDITELLDEAFLYVHTMKEPSNMFHENVKAVKTIIQFQEEYDRLSEKHRYGCFNGEKDWREFLMEKTKIGCSTSVIIDSVKNTIELEKPFF